MEEGANLHRYYPSRSKNCGNSLRFIKIPTHRAKTFYYRLSLSYLWNIGAWGMCIQAATWTSRCEYRAKLLFPRRWSVVRRRRHDGEADSLPVADNAKDCLGTTMQR